MSHHAGRSFADQSPERGPLAAIPCRTVMRIGLWRRMYNVRTLGMEEPRFEWDPGKATRNLREHGVSFAEAESVFSDDFAILIPDPDHSRREDRFILVGLSAAVRVLVVVHGYREQNVIRIISARKATPSERAQYAWWKP